MKDIDAYSAWAETKWFSAACDHGDDEYKFLRNLFIMSMGLGGETGEVLEYLKKYIRDGTLDEKHLILELGDVMNYITAICRCFNILPSTVLAANVEKLESRLARGKQRGSGDDR